MAKKILIIGIDGGTWKILKPALQQGTMPHLKNLMETGASGILQSTIPSITPAAWGSFQTGRNPGANGVFDFAHWDKNQKRFFLASSRSLSTTIWKIAGDAGKRTALLNVPMTYPPQTINGCMVTGILTPSLESNFTYPTELKAELLAAVPDYHIFKMGDFSRKNLHRQFESFIQQMQAILENRAQAAKFLLARKPWDLFMVHFQASDVLQHALWGYMDKNHSLYDPARREYIFQNFYRRLDKKIQEIQKCFADNCKDDFLTFIISDHGFQAHQKRFNLCKWLTRQGFLKLNPRSSKMPILKIMTKKIRLGKMLGKILPARTITHMEKTLRLNIDNFIWEDSRAFSMGRSGEGFVYLLEDNASQREKTASDIIAGLENLRDPQTNSSVVETIYRKEEIYHGNFLELMPDLIIIPKPGYSFTGAYKPRENLFHNVRPDSDFHIGKHHPDGIIIAWGKDIQCQHNLRAHLTDMAPTLLYYLGLPGESDMDGRVLQELFPPEFNQNRPLSSQKPPSPELKTDISNQYSPEEEKEIQDRLSDLGYM